MADLSLSASCVEKLLASFIKQYASNVSARVESGKAIVTFGTMLGSFNFKLECIYDEPVTRVRIDMESPFAMRFVLPFKRASLMKQFPFIEKLETDQVVINFEKIPVGEATLTDWIEPRKIHVPSASGAFGEFTFAIKELKELPCPN